MREVWVAVNENDEPVQSAVDRRRLPTTLRCVRYVPASKPIPNDPQTRHEDSVYRLRECYSEVKAHLERTRAAYERNGTQPPSAFPEVWRFVTENLERLMQAPNE